MCCSVLNAIPLAALMNALTSVRREYSQIPMVQVDRLALRRSAMGHANVPLPVLMRSSLPPEMSLLDPIRDAMLGHHCQVGQWELQRPAMSHESCSLVV
jgi:hypothetical protein